MPAARASSDVMVCADNIAPESPHVHEDVHEVRDRRWLIRSSMRSRSSDSRVASRATSGQPDFRANRAAESSRTGRKLWGWSSMTCRAAAGDGTQTNSGGGSSIRRYRAVTAASALGRSAGRVDKPYLSQSSLNRRAMATRSAEESGREKELRAVRAPRSDPPRGPDTTLTRGWRCPPLESSWGGA
jgi:hypothetical protein